MRSNDVLSKEEARELMQKAIQEDNPEAFGQAMNQMMQCIGFEIRQQYEEQLQQLMDDKDAKVLTARGVRQLTSKEKQYYQKLAEAMGAPDPKQALANLDVVMPETVLDAVFDELQTSHPLLSRIGFTPTNGRVRMLLNTNGYQEAQWGQLCDEIVKELLSGFKEVDTGLLKLSAFVPVCKAMLDLGPEWLDNYVRQILYESLANGLEAGIVTGDGNGKPIGMNRDVSDGVSVKAGAYPEKSKIKVTEFSTETIGNLLSLIAVDANGKPRTVRDLILLVNPQDYYQKVMPATTLMAPDGTYRNDVMPYPMTIIQTAALTRGNAILGMGYKYFGAAGMGTTGQIEYSDHYQFLEDNRAYLIKIYANGFPMDDNAFLNLDISGLLPKVYRVEQITPPEPSDDATLSDLKIGSLELSPEFAAATTSYTTSTTNATNTITATPAVAGSKIDITVRDTDGTETKSVDNGSAVTWYDGSNTVTVNVTAEDGTTTKAYTVTVTKS